VLFLHCELSLALHQPELALEQAGRLEALLATGPPALACSEEAEGGEAGRVLVLKARCQVMARQTRSLKKELKSVSLPGPLGHTCEFVRAHIEALHNNHRKSIKMLNSCVQTGGNRIFPHFYNNLGCLHQGMRKPNMAVHFFKSALDRLDGSQGGGGDPGGRVPGGESSSWLTQSQVTGCSSGVKAHPTPQVLYNIGVSLLHAKRAGLAFDILVEVVGAHYLDPHVWFHLAECCIMAGQPDNDAHFSASGGRAGEVSGREPAGAGPTRHLVAGDAKEPDPASGLAAAATPSLTLDFAYMCLKNAESLLPSSEEAATSGVFCEGVGYIGNPVSWPEVEGLRVAVLAAQAYTALTLGDYIPAGRFAQRLLDTKEGSSLPGGYRLLGHLYAAESLILQDRLPEALIHLNPDHVTSVDVAFPGGAEAGRPAALWFPDSLDTGKAAVQFNLAVGFALREEWDKASSIVSQLYRDGSDVPVQVTK
jgi:CCR4-NOT transcription complex subunit 10